MKKQIILALALFSLLSTLTSAKRNQSCKPKLLPLSSVHIIDRNGFTETVGNKERLRQLQGVNFLTPQPYQKVLRIYARDSGGNIRSIVTTYHENGNPKQFLEIVNARACGKYYEWHENGKMSITAQVVGGAADVTPLAEKSWLFDGPSWAWNDKEQAIAEVQYSQGSLEGMTTYFHPNGQIWKRLPYCKNQLDGIVEIFLSDGALLQQTNYCQGQINGPNKRYWNSDLIASDEEYCRGRLESGLYFDLDGNMIAEVQNGTGFRAIFGKSRALELQEFRDGTLEGEVKVFNQEGSLKRIYHVQNGIKHGEEIEYYNSFFNSTSQQQQPKLAFFWNDGKVQGMVKTWYPSGVLESQKEMANNAKNGVLTAWYKDASLMLIEEYDHNLLIRGDYFKKGDRMPVSQIREGRGVATLYNPDGHFSQKISYLNGKPDNDSH